VVVLTVDVVLMADVVTSVVVEVVVIVVLVVLVVALIVVVVEEVLVVEDTGVEVVVVVPAHAPMTQSLVWVFVPLFRMTRFPSYEQPVIGKAPVIVFMPP
jgi:hypothetical protein